MTACSRPGCRDGWVWVDVADDEYIKQRCPACERISSGADARRAARRFGWTRNAGHDLCPDHSLPTQENDQ